MLILLQHNVAHLGIVRGQCLAECAYEFLPKWLSRTVLSTAGIAAVATALAEFIGAAIALKMLFGIPLVIGSVLTAIVCTIMLITNSYSKLERIIAGFVSLHWPTLWRSIWLMLIGLQRVLAGSIRAYLMNRCSLS